jgi:hypothetical protein
MNRNPSTPQPPSTEKLDPKALAETLREAARLRARKIRRSISALALGLFTAAFLAVYVQLASGHDPALSANRKSTTASSLATGTSSKAASKTTSEESASGSSSSESSTSESSPSSEESTTSSSSSGESSEGTESPSSVTTSQS